MTSFRPFFQKSLGTTAVLLACYPLLLPAQPVQAQQPLPLQTQMTPADFDKWIDKINEADAETTEPEHVAQATLQRLAGGLYTTDDSILNAVNIYQKSETAKSRKAGAKPQDTKFRYPGTIDFISRMLPLLYKRDGLIANLHKQAADAYLLEGKREEASTHLEQAHTLFKAIHVSDDKAWLESAVTLATISAAKKPKELEDLYNEAFSYPWYQLGYDPAALDFLKQQYVLAGRGLIDLKSNSLKDLKNIVYFPAVESALGPYLQDAIDRAQKRHDEREAMLKAAAEKDKANQAQQ